MLDDVISYLQGLPNFVWNLIIVAFALLIGFVLRAIFSFLITRFGKKQSSKDYSLIQSISKRVSAPLTIFFPLFALALLKDQLQLSRSGMALFDKVFQIALTANVAVILIAVVKIAEDYAVHRFDSTKTDNLRERKVRTQLQFIRQLVVAIIIIVTLCLIFLSFDNLRKLGAGLLTGVGIGGIIIGFAAQRSLGNLLAGFQIAFTQPIRLDDVLVVEGEWGRVEEITLTYVVINIWDSRRLILPINYFIEKPFQNWTRTGSAILGTAMLYLDYTVPVDELRREFLDFIQKQTIWDKRVAAFQITDLKEKTVEVRCLISANNASLAFDLRCYVREHMLNYVQKNYPHALPKTRIEIEPKGEETPAA